MIVEDKAIEPKGEILILAGDIFKYSNFQVMLDFMSVYGPKFNKIFYVPGNHEFYGSPIYRSFPADCCHGGSRELENLVVLDSDAYYTDGLRIVGTTLWSGVTKNGPNYVNDYSQIRGFTPIEENHQHQFCLDYLKKELETPHDGKTIVVTHHLPLLECIDSKYFNAPSNQCFASDQSKLMLDNKIDLWVHGHSHSFMDEVLYDTRHVRNPLGYEHEWGKFKTDFVVEVPITV
jgi:hypothetical protein